MNDVLIPEDALLQHIAFLGKTGAGKTTAAKGRIEELIRQGRRCCVVDPTGVWWGLRLAADGVSPGLPVVIFGGNRADVPVTDKDGAKVAELVASGIFSSVIDTKGMTVGQRTRFFADFASALFRLNDRPLHLVLDEAHVFAPQGKVPNPAAGQMLHAANELVSGGRSQGLRIMLLTQRPAKLHKDALTQVETLVAMRLIAPQDRAAVKAWIGEWGDANTGRDIEAALPSLVRGAAYVWSPESGFLELVQFPPATTFDSSRAPVEGDERIHPPTLEELPLDDIRAALASEPSAPEKTAKAAPGSVSEAEHKLALANMADTMFHEGKRAGSIEGHAEGVRVGISQALGELRPIIARLEALAYGESWTPVEGMPEPSNVVELPVLKAAPMVIKGVREPAPSAAEASARRENDFTVTAPLQNILDALRWGLELLKAEELDRTTLAFLAGVSPKASGYQNNLGKLRGYELIDYPSPGVVSLRPAGRALSRAPSTPPTLAAMTDAICEKLSGPQGAILRHLLTMNGTSVLREEIAVAVGKSPSASGFQNDLGRLRSLGLVTYPVPGRVAPSGFLYTSA